tara:strand:+ start:346 stop:1164 length:819 start_codon:yes stop_codon:yes gene_type:complete
MQLETKVKNTISKYKLLNKKEKILVALSGGKDSTVIAYLLKKFGYNIEGLHIDLGLGKYSDRCLEKIKEFCKEQGIKLHVLDIKKHFGTRMCYIRQGVQKEINVSNCMVCGIVKKWMLNRWARKLRASKIVTGHHLDDEAQTVIMNLLQGNLDLGINSGPITGSTQDKKFVSRIKPLYFIAENDIREYSKLKKLPVIYDPCPCAVSSLRIRVRGFLENKPKKDKEKIVDNFLKMLPEMRKKIKDWNIVYCKICGEPARNKLCKKCELLSLKR